MIKTVWIRAYKAEIGKWEEYDKPTGETQKGLIGDKTVTAKERRWVKTGLSDCRIDGKRLAKDMETAIQSIENEGYEVLHITEVLSGDYNWKEYCTAGPGPEADTAVSWGYSYLEGVVITAKKAG